MRNTGRNDDFCVLMPARMASSRLPGKLLLDIAGRPAIYHSWCAAMKSGAARTVIAADGPEIAAVAEGFGAEVCRTDPQLPSGTDRCLAAAGILGLKDSTVVVNLQADELSMPPENIGRVAEILLQSGADMATLAQPLQPEEASLPERVKVVCNGMGDALYFSRSPIPWDGGDGQKMLHHLGIYAYRIGALRRFATLEPSPLEQAERLEQLRALEAGMRIAVGITDSVPAGLDTEADLRRLRQSLGQGAASRP